MRYDLDIVVEQSSFSHGISIDELKKTENLITVEELDSFWSCMSARKAIIIICRKNGVSL